MSGLYDKAKLVCFIYMQPQKVKFTCVQINIKQVSKLCLGCIQMNIVISELYCKGIILQRNDGFMVIFL